MDNLNRTETLRLLKSKRKRYLNKKAGLIPYRSWVYLFGQRIPKNVKHSWKQDKL